MGKKILYVTNYYLDDVVKQRHSEPYISQAGQNKGRYIMDMLRTGGNDVTEDFSQRRIPACIIQILWEFRD